MKPRPYASTRWTGDPPPTNQQGWTAQVGQAFVPPHLQNLPVSGYAPDELAAKRQAALLILSPLLLWLAGIVVQDATSDYLIGAPLITFLWPVALAAGVGLWVLAGKGVARNVCRRLGQVGWIGVVITAIIYPAAAIYAHGEATPGHQMRSQIANIEVHGRKYRRT